MLKIPFSSQLIKIKKSKSVKFRARMRNILRLGCKRQVGHHKKVEKVGSVGRIGLEDLKSD